MKHLLLALLLAVSAASALADTPAQISADFRKLADAALSKLNGMLEKATTPLIAKLVSSGDVAGAERLTTQFKSKLAGEPVPTPQASATLLFAQYDQARAKALEPVQKACIARIESLLKPGSGSPKLEMVTELGKVRAEIEAGNPAAQTESAAVTSATVTPTSAGAAKSVSELVKSLGGTCVNSSEGEEISFVSKNLTTEELLQIGAAKRLKVFTWNGGTGMTDEGLAAFAGMKNLSGLFLWSTGRITDAGLKHLSGCEKLEALNIGANGDNITGTGFESLGQCKSLRQLTLNALPKIDGQNLRFLVKLKSFENLRLSACKLINDADMEWVGQMTQLIYLHLGNTSVTDAGLAKLSGLRHLKELTVSAPLVTPEGVKVLTQVRPYLVVTFAK